MKTLHALFLPLLLALALGLTAGTAQAALSKAPAPTTHVVTVGQAYLEKAIRVRETGPVNADVITVAQAFRQRGAQVHTLAEEQLTRTALQALLKEVGKAMKSQDSLVFHFSGFSGQAGSSPVLFVQGSEQDAEASIKGGERQIPLAELQEWLAATGAPSLLMLLDIGPGSASYCGPWTRTGPIQALTTVCAEVPAEKPDQAGPFATALAAGLKGLADTNADHQFTGDELAAWLRSQLPGGATVYQTGPVVAVQRAPLDKAASTNTKTDDAGGSH